MQTIGLTGGIACGKSEVQTRLRFHDVPVLDTDDLAHQLLEAGSPQAEEIGRVFGDAVLDKGGGVNRARLGEIIFKDKALRQRLNDIMHPEIRKQWQTWLAEQQGLRVVSIPLLYECGYAEKFDGVLCIWAPEHHMKQRLLNRGLTPEAAAHRIAAQWPVDRKAALADWTLKNDGSLETLHSRVDTWLSKTRPEKT